MATEPSRGDKRLSLQLNCNCLPSQPHAPGLFLSMIAYDAIFSGGIRTTDDTTDSYCLLLRDHHFDVQSRRAFAFARPNVPLTYTAFD